MRIGRKASAHPRGKEGLQWSPRVALLVNSLDSMRIGQYAICALGARKIKLLTIALEDGIARQTAEFYGPTHLIKAAPRKIRSLLKSFRPDLIYVMDEWAIKLLEGIAPLPFPILIHRVRPSKRLPIEDLLQKKWKAGCEWITLKPTMEPEANPDGSVSLDLPSEVTSRIGSASQPGSVIERFMDGTPVNRGETFLLRALGISPAMSNKQILLRAPDWPALGVKQKWFMFFTGRCGSTWLDSMMKESRVLPSLNEWLNESVARPKNRDYQARTLQAYFERVVEEETVDGTFAFRCDPFRFFPLTDIVDWDGIFDLATTKFFWMYREDLVEQAYSYVFANRTFRYHSFQQARNQIDGGLDPDDSEAMREMWWYIIAIARGERQVLNYFDRRQIKPTVYTYEDFRSRPRQVLGEFAQILGVPDEALGSLDQAKGETEKIRYDSKEAFLDAFTLRFEPLLVPVREERMSFDIDALLSQLRDAAIEI